MNSTNQKHLSYFENVFGSAAQKDLDCTESGEQGPEVKIFSGLLDGTGEYTLFYEDSEGSRTRVGDLPWK